MEPQPNTKQAKCAPGSRKTRTHILAIRWLLQETRRVGSVASSLVIYMKDTVDTNLEIRMGEIDLFWLPLERFAAVDFHPLAQFHLSPHQRRQMA